MSNFKKLLILIIIISGFFIGCSGTKEAIYEDPSFKNPMNLAVLPFKNQTTDLAVGELGRLFFAIGMKEKGYNVQDLSVTDSLLMQIGITDGGQLESVSLSDVQKKLGVDGVLIGDVIEAENSTLAILSKKKVEINIKVFKNGSKIWEDEEDDESGGIGNILNPLQGLAQQVVDKSFQKMFAKYHGDPLEALTESVAYKLQDKMPGERVEKSGWN